jgi:uncharacterized protein YukE
MSRKGVAMTPEEERLISNFNAMSTQIKKQAGGKAGESYEKQYGIAYQALVKAKLKPQIRKKYR